MELKDITKKWQNTFEQIKKLTEQERTELAQEFINFLSWSKKREKSIFKDLWDYFEELVVSVIYYDESKFMKLANSNTLNYMLFRSFFVVFFEDWYSTSRKIKTYNS